MSDSGQINDHFQRDIQVACKKAIEQFRQAHPTADVCGFALYSDADARTLVPSFNTADHLTRCRLKNLLSSGTSNGHPLNGATKRSVANTSTPCRSCCGTWLIRFPMKILNVTARSSSNTVLRP
jgi:hypothetical protein